MSIKKQLIIFSIIILLVIASFLNFSNKELSAAQSGDLIKIESLSSVYYLASDGKRYVFPNEVIYMSWYSDFSNVATISDEEMAAYPLGGNLTIRPGTKLVKVTTDPRVYAVEPGGELRWVESEAVAIAVYGKNWAKRVVDISDAFIGSYRVNGKFYSFKSNDDVVDTKLVSGEYPAGTLVQWENSPDIYYINSDGLTSPIDSEETFIINRFKRSDIIILPLSLALSPSGETIVGFTTAVSDAAAFRIKQAVAGITIGKKIGGGGGSSGGGGGGSSSGGGGGGGNNSGGGSAPEPDACSIDNDCDDGDVSTSDSCGGSPKVCSNTTITACVDDDNYCPSSCVVTNDNNCSLTELDSQYTFETANSCTSGWGTCWENNYAFIKTMPASTTSSYFLHASGEAIFRNISIGGTAPQLALSVLEGSGNSSDGFYFSVLVDNAVVASTTLITKDSEAVELTVDFSDYIDQIVDIAFVTDENTSNSWDQAALLDPVLTMPNACGNGVINAGETSSNCLADAGQEIDLNTTFIERTPRYERYNVTYSAVNTPTGISNAGVSQPSNGDIVTFAAHVVNKGADTAPASAYQWSIDGAEVAAGDLPSLASGAEAIVEYGWTWADAGDHTVTFSADSAGEISEVYETNNSITNSIDAYYLRIQVEQEVYDNFNASVNNAGTKSFEDWIQFHIARMNTMITSGGGNISVRIDDIDVVDNDTLPDGGTHADPNWDWDGSWGFERTGWTPSVINTWINNIEYALIHELTHQLGIIDAYNLNYDWNYVAANEIIPICASCPDGSYCGGQVAIYEMCTYYNSSLLGLMRGGGNDYSAYDIASMNATAGFRRGYFGEYLLDVPAANTLIFKNQTSNAPVTDAQIDVYQASNVAIRLADNILSATTDSNGQVALPNQPFTAIPTTETGYSLSANPFGDINIVGLNGIFLIKITKGENIDYQYMDISQFNMEYWEGNTSSAEYTILTSIE
ncbi:MAG: CARDB domain-containing protein [bacterium]|nr:CARDB domain-containing protein [bacterium]